MKNQGDRGRYRCRKCSGTGMHSGSKKKHGIFAFKNTQATLQYKRQKWEGRTQRNIHNALAKKDGKRLFLLLPRSSAWVASLHVDHDLPSEDALAVVDRDRVCDSSHTYSIEIGEKRVRRRRMCSLPPLVFLLTLNCVYSFNAVIRRCAGLTKLSCQRKRNAFNILFLLH